MLNLFFKVVSHDLCRNHRHYTKVYAYVFINIYNYKYTMPSQFKIIDYI